MENDHPFISENGGAIFIPKDYFSFPFPYDRESDGYAVLELGTFYPLILEVLKSIKQETGIQIIGFSDLTEEELTSLCGLSPEEAEFAKKREYDEPFIIRGRERGGDGKRRDQKEGNGLCLGGVGFIIFLGRMTKERQLKS